MRRTAIVRAACVRRTAHALRRVATGLAVMGLAVTMMRAAAAVVVVAAAVVVLVATGAMGRHTRRTAATVSWTTTRRTSTVVACALDARAVDNALRGLTVRWAYAALTVRARREAGSRARPTTSVRAGLADRTALVRMRTARHARLTVRV